MSITVSILAVRRRLWIADGAYDTEIAALINEIVPTVEYALRAAFSGTLEAGLQATLNLGATELVAGELGAQMGRRLGARDTLRIADLTLTPPSLDANDPTGLKAQGSARLKPYLRAEAVILAGTGVGAAYGKAGEEQP